MQNCGNSEKIGQKLQSKINEFNSSFKLGIDLGTKSGGIALVKDNDVVFARTFVDYHATDVIERRLHRRNRRSRRTKEKRIALLRSWVLRHKVNGKQLPDPYKLLDFQFYKKGDMPSKIKGDVNWTNLVTNGKDVSAEAFVKALVMIFSRRGQDYNRLEIENLDDKEFLRLLREKTTICLEEFEELSGELESRYKTGVYSDLQYGNMMHHLSKIQNQSKEKGRKEKEEELGKIVDVFCISNGINENEKITCSNELIKLLSKRVRKARFKNRIVIRCNVCNRPTPSKRNPVVRELNYKVAVRNFLKVSRIQESEDIKNHYKDLYERSQSVRDKILSGDEINAEDKKEKSKIIRAILPKEYESENQFILSKQNDIKEQINGLLFSKLSGRSRYCTEHLSKKAEGLEDVDKGLHGHIGKRHDRNVALMNHDKRVLNLLEKLLFEYDESLSNQIKVNGIKYISIEAPEPKTKRARKGKTTERDNRKLKEKLFDACDGICLYTGEKLDRTKIFEYEVDHIFPKSRDGPSIQDNLVLTTRSINKEKDNRTPWEWLYPDSERWQQFIARCNEFYKKGRLTGRKLEILLNKYSDYPGNNPTELARVGGRVGNFQLELIDLIKKHGIEEPQTLYQEGKPIIQVVRGQETQKLRRQWGIINPHNVPPLKDKKSAFNHAEDAAIIASMPPKIWREQIYRHVGAYSNGKERPDFAIPELAPHWEDYLQSTKQPVVAILGHMKYSWKTSIIDDTFYIRHSKDARYPYIYKQKSSNVDDIKAENVEPRLLKDKHMLNNGKKYYHKIIDNKRYLIESQLGGTLMDIKPRDGPWRRIQIKPVFEAIIILSNGKKFHKPIRPILRLYSEGKIDKDSITNETLKESLLAYESKNAFIDKPIMYIKHHDVLWLEKTKLHDRGYFIITKLGEDSIKMKPEAKVKISKDVYNSILDNNMPNDRVAHEGDSESELTLTNEDIKNLLQTNSQNT